MPNLPKNLLPYISQSLCHSVSLFSFLLSLILFSFLSSFSSSFFQFSWVESLRGLLLFVPYEMLVTIVIRSIQIEASRLTLAQLGRKHTESNKKKISRTLKKKYLKKLSQSMFLFYLAIFCQISIENFYYTFIIRISRIDVSYIILEGFRASKFDSCKYLK